MKKKEKRNLIILIIVATIISIFLISMKNNKEKTNEDVEEKKVEEEFVQVLEDGTKLNVSEELKETKKIDGIEITNIQLTERNGLTVLLADATNTTQTDKGVLGIYIVILDKQGNELAKVPGAVSPLKTGETKQLNIGVTHDYANAYDFKVEKQENN